MWPLLLSLVAFVAVCAVFGVLVWFASGIARVETRRSVDDLKMIAACQRLNKQESETQ